MSPLPTTSRLPASNVDSDALLDRDAFTASLGGVRRTPSPLGVLQRRASNFIAPKYGSVRAGVLTLTFSAVGSGILGLPWAFAALGGGVGMCLLLVCAGLSAAGLEMLLAVRRATGVTSYNGAVDLVLGKWAGKLLIIFLICGSFGSMCASMMFATDFALDAAELLVPGSTKGRGFLGADPRLLATAALGAVILGTAWPRDVTRWRCAGVLCVAVLLYVSVSLIAESALSNGHEVGARCVREPGDGFVFAEVPVFTAFCQAASVFLYSFCCHFNLFPVAETLTEPTRARCRALGWATTVLQTCLYAAVGFAGYSTWHQALLRMGNNSGNVLWCWGVDDIAMTLGRTLMILTLVLSLTLNFHPVRENIMRLIFECTPRRARLRWLVRTCAVDPVGHASMPGMSPSSTLPTHADLFTVENARSWIYGAVTVLVLALCVYVSYVVPSVLDVLGFVGGVAGVSLMFLFPGLLYVKTHGIDPKVGAVLALFTAVGFLGLSSATFSVLEVVGGKS